MKYQHFDELPDLIARKLLTCRPHPNLPIDIYNYSAQAQFMPIAEWTDAMKDCRGLILDRQEEIVGRPFRKFWNYDQVQAEIPDGDFTVWEKLDGSLGIACTYDGQLVTATRGSFESTQAKWLSEFMRQTHAGFLPDGVTYLFEIVFPANRIVVDYGDTEDAFLLGVMSDEGEDLWASFDGCERFQKARRFDGVSDFDTINDDPQFAGHEGFVVQWQSGFRCKVKLLEYKRLHRLITQCSTRTIWELLRGGKDTQELLDRVPEEFGVWARNQIGLLSEAQSAIMRWAYAAMLECPVPAAATRREFAEWAKLQPHPSLLFSRLDGRDIGDAAWKIVEPRWSTPFRAEAE